MSGEVTPGFEALRRRAELTLSAAGFGPGGATPDEAEIPRLLEEVRVQRCELEIQNEELRRAQLELQEAHDLYFELFDLAPIPYMAVGRDFVIREANLAAAELLDHGRRRLVGRRLAAFVAGEDVPRFHTFWRGVFESGSRSSCGVALRRAESSFPARISALATKGPDERARVVILDLSEVSMIRAALAESRGRFRSIFESTGGGGIVVSRANGRISEANPAFCRFLGYDEHELKQRTILDLFHAEDRDASRGAFERSRLDPCTGLDLEARYLRKDGAVVWGHVSGSWVLDHAGAPLYSVGLVQDVTSRKRAELRLREHRAELRGILETVTDAVVTAGGDGRIRSINPRGEALFGYAPGELLGRNVGVLAPGSLGKRHDQFIARYLRTGVARMIGSGREMFGRRRDGQEFPIRLSISEVQLPNRRLFCAFIQDLTQARRLTERLHLAQRMEAVGTLASGIAHDFNNLLMGVSGCANMALDQLPAGHPGRLYVEEIRQSVGRGADTVRQLIGYSRRSQGEVSPATSVDLDAVVTRCQGLLEPLLGEGIALSLALAATGRRVMGDAVRLEQILLNLGSNARDAMPSGGEVRISTRHVQLRDDPQGLAGGDYVSLVVSDTGTGIDPEIRQRLFDPFFSTKPESMGSGLGLFSCYAILQEWGGNISVASVLGEGSQFEVLLPVAGGGSPAPEPGSPTRSPPPEGETVLLVEDDRLVRLTTRYYLEEAGYRVIEAERGDEAVDRARAHAPVAVVLTDVTLPGYHGARVAREIRALGRDVPVVFMSAHPRDVLMADGQLESAVPLLVKPFTSEALLEELALALGRTPVAGYPELPPAGS